jgi:hypothetical protein
MSLLKDLAAQATKSLGDLSTVAIRNLGAQQGEDRRAVAEAQAMAARQQEQRDQTKRLLIIGAAVVGGLAVVLVIVRAFAPKS